MSRIIINKINRYQKFVKKFEIIANGKKRNNNDESFKNLFSLNILFKNMFIKLNYFILNIIPVKL